MTTRQKVSGETSCPINRLILCALTVLTCSLLPTRGSAQTGEDAVAALVQMGFENVGWTEDDEERVYVLENSAYRLASVGIAHAIDVIQERGLPDKKPCRIIVLDNNVPQVSLSYEPIIGDSVPEPERADWSASYNVDRAWKKVRKAERRNSSLYKVDILVYPQLLYKNVIITQIYQACVEISPAVEVSLWKGSRLQLQVIFPAYNDGYYYERENIRPGFLTLEQDFRLPHNIWLQATVGVFSRRTFGLDLQAKHTFRDERFSAEARIGVVGVGYFNDMKTFKYDGSQTICYWSVGGDFYWPYFNTQFKLRVEEYLKHDVGVKFEMIRHFKYASICFYAEKCNKADSNGGFSFIVALPPYKYKRHGYIPRVNLSHGTGFVYNAGNQAYYYLMPYSSATDRNIMMKNQYNPQFIESEIRN